MTEKSSLCKNQLSNRQTEILALISQGFSRREIGEQLSISSRTVRNHVQYAKSKLEDLNLIPDFPFQGSSIFLAEVAANHGWIPPISLDKINVLRKYHQLDQININ